MMDEEKLPSMPQLHNDTAHATAGASPAALTSALPLNSTDDTTSTGTSSSSSTTGQKELRIACGDSQIQAAATNSLRDGEALATIQEELSTKRKTIIVCALCLCVLMGAMDQTIVTTAIPVIVGRFNSPSGYTWIGTTYLLLSAAFLPSWGKFSDIFGRKPVLLVACTIFMVGSILCAIAQNIATMLTGRAVQGLASGGLVGLVNATISDLIAVRERGFYLAFVGATWAIASAIGPILGGVFTQYVTWRLCFWINVPISLIAMSALFFLLNLQRPPTATMEGIKQVDWLGTILLVSGTILFLLGLELGGVSYPWDSPIVVSFIVFGTALMAVFMLVEWKFAESPLIPPRLFRHRTSVASYLVGFFHGFVFMAGCYFLPLYFQAVRGSSVLMSGIFVLPYAFSLSVTGVITGRVISRTGSYREMIWGGVTLMTLGAGLLSNLNRTSSWAKIVVYQIIFGVGAGPLLQAPLISLHSMIEQKDVVSATVTYSFIRILAAALSVSLGLVVFQNVMDREATALNSVLPLDIIKAISGSTASASVPLIHKLPSNIAIYVKDAFGKGLQSMWYFFLACSIVGSLSALAIGKHHLSTIVQSAQPAQKRRKVVKDAEAAMRESL